jgi:hypothetical protein
LVDAIVKLLKAALLAIATAAIGAVPAQAQIGALLVGPLDGSYCKIKKNDFIEVDSSLSLKYDEALVTKMTFRRLAELTRSKGFSAFVTEEFTCGTLLRNGAPVGRRCRIRAKMENTAEPPPQLKTGEKRFVADEVMASTESDAASFPRYSGVMNSGNKCVAPPQP